MFQLLVRLCSQFGFEGFLGHQMVYFPVIVQARFCNGSGNVWHGAESEVFKYVAVTYVLYDAALRAMVVASVVCVTVGNAD